MAGRKRKLEDSEDHLASIPPNPRASIPPNPGASVPPHPLASVPPNPQHISDDEDYHEVTSQEQSSPYFKADPNKSRVGENFFYQPCIALARGLLGKVLVRRRADGSELRGRVVETEAYLGGEDSASHSAGGRRTERNAAMFMKPGTIYVYQIYGVYLCMNISSEGEGAAVLLRSLEPLQGQSTMRALRVQARGRGRGQARGHLQAQPLADKLLCNGPAKLCQALDITRLFDRRDLAADPEVWLEHEPVKQAEGAAVVVAARVGISPHGDWAQKPLRFYLLGNTCVSVVNREAERPSPR